VIGGVLVLVAVLVAAMGQARPRPAAVEAAPAAEPGRAVTVADDLLRLIDAHKSGSITDAEYEAAKDALLAK
jgi:hypothetical protein